MILYDTCMCINIKFLKVAQKLGQRPCTYSTGSLAKFHQNWLGENSPFL